MPGTTADGGASHCPRMRAMSGRATSAVAPVGAGRLPCAGSGQSMQVMTLVAVFTARPPQAEPAIDSPPKSPQPVSAARPAPACTDTFATAPAAAAARSNTGVPLPAAANTVVGANVTYAPMPAAGCMGVPVAKPSEVATRRPHTSTATRAAGAVPAGAAHSRVEAVRMVQGVAAAAIAPVSSFTHAATVADDATPTQAGTSARGNAAKLGSDSGMGSVSVRFPPTPLAGSTGGDDTTDSSGAGANNRLRCDAGTRPAPPSAKPRRSSYGPAYMGAAASAHVTALALMAQGEAHAGAIHDAGTQAGAAADGTSCMETRPTAAPPRPADRIVRLCPPRSTDGHAVTTARAGHTPDREEAPNVGDDTATVSGDRAAHGRAGSVHVCACTDGDGDHGHGAPSNVKDDSCGRGTGWRGHECEPATQGHGGWPGSR
jgi:hypothetical protein